MTLEKKSADLVLVVSRPDGEKVAEAKGAAAGQTLGVVLVARASGKHPVEVRSVAKEGSPAASYSLIVSELRPATDKDRSRVAAAKAYTEAMRLVERGTPQSLRESIERFNTARSLYKAIGEVKDEAAILSQLGSISVRLREHRNATDYYAQALAIYRDVGDRSNEAVVSFNMAGAYANLGEGQKALEHYERALPILRGLGNRAYEAATLRDTGAVYFSLSDYRKALDLYTQALAVYREARDRDGEGTILGLIGRALRSLEENRDALDSYSQALVIHRETGDRRGEAGAHYNIAGIYVSLNEYDKALDHFNRALAGVKDLKDKRAEAAVLTGLGGLYSSLGDYDTAIHFLDQSLQIYTSVGDRSSEANVLSAKAEAHLRLGDYQKALDLYTSVLTLVRALGDSRRETITLTNVGAAYASLGENQKALDYYNRALAMNRSLGRRRGEAAILNNMGRVYLSLGDPQKALDYHRPAMEIIRPVHDRRAEAQMLYNTARAYRGLGDLVEARTHVEEAVRIAETLRYQVSAEELRAAFFASVQSFFDLNIDLLMRLHKHRSSGGLDSAAFEVSERARARSLLELLAEAPGAIRKDVDPTLLEQELLLAQKLNASAQRQARLLEGKHTPEQAEAAAREVAVTIAEYQQVQARIRAASPRYAALTQPQPVSLKEIQEQALDPDTLLLEYALGDERSYLWALTRQAISSYDLPKRSDIEAAARRFYELVRKPDAEQPGGPGPRELEEAAESLSRMLLLPVAGQLGSKRLVIVPDGVLHYIPFGALPSPETPSIDEKRRGSAAEKGSGGVASRRNRVPLIIQHEVVNLPSASVLAQLRDQLAGRKPAARAIAVFADPVFSSDDPRLRPGRQIEVPRDTARIADYEMGRAMRDVGLGGSRASFTRLVFSRREAEAILATVPPAQAFKALDFEANRDLAVTHDLIDYRILHFAAHGLLNGNHPELSGIVLSLVDESGQSRNGFLRLHEIYNLKLGAELVVLSACQTGLGKEVRGEGLVGLVRGFMYAGSPRVVASLWKVDDAATADLMKRFYRNMIGKQMRPAAALRQAQTEMWKQRRWRHPYYWSAFALQGEWR
jgi:CHAT domain-containing protein/Tfp pilus assembly protein PilF